MTEKWSQLGATLWDESVPIAGTPAEAYLRGRGITSLPGPEVLRFHPAARHPKLKLQLPVLIAQVTGGVEPSHNSHGSPPTGRARRIPRRRNSDAPSVRAKAAPCASPSRSTANL